MLDAWGITLTLEIARQVKQWRVEEDSTWRVVAALADERWGTETQGNQLFGEDLCRESALLLGEDPNSEPWS